MRSTKLIAVGLLLGVTISSGLSAQVTTGSGSTSVGANATTTNPRLGIGTTNPDYPLHILCGDYTGTTIGLGSTYPNNGILIQKNAGTSGATLYLEHLATGGRRWGVTSGGSGNSGVGNFIISDFNAGADRLVIKGGTGEVGIGTTSPTAQLHTTGSVRFAGLTSNTTLNDVLVRDANGNVYYRNISTLMHDTCCHCDTGTGAGLYWKLTGNAITGTEFLGTTNSNDLRFRTSNTQRMVVTAAGKIGIGVTAPTNAFELTTTDLPFTGNNGMLVSNTGTHGACLFLENANTGGKRWGFTSTGTSNAGGAGNLAVSDFTTGINAMVVEGGSGNVGINVNTPTAKLHTDGSVRFENLPSGSGNALVIDANGYLQVAQSVLYRPVGESDPEVVALKDEVNELKNEIEELKAMIKGSNPCTDNTAILYQNMPNPFDHSTSIRYYTAAGTQRASMQITDLTGKIVKGYSLIAGGEHTLTIQAGE
ncbi:MAG: hypothetical protein ABI480_06450, partial [Chitinophagaceae bacterium]